MMCFNQRNHGVIIMAISITQLPRYIWIYDLSIEKEISKLHKTPDIDRIHPTVALKYWKDFCY